MGDRTRAELTLGFFGLSLTWDMHEDVARDLVLSGACQDDDHAANRVTEAMQLRRRTFSVSGMDWHSYSGGRPPTDTASISHITFHPVAEKRSVAQTSRKRSREFGYDAQGASGVRHCVDCRTVVAGPAWKIRCVECWKQSR